MNNLKNNEYLQFIKSLLTDWLFQQSVWQHPFSFSETSNSGFRIFYTRNWQFYLLALMSCLLAIPLVATTLLSIWAVFNDPFEYFMLFFSIALNLLRIYFVKVLYDFVNDAWREIRYDSFDKMMIIEHKSPWLPFSGGEAFHLKDAEGLEIRLIELTNLKTSSAFDCSEQACEIRIKLKDGRSLILIPKIDTIQEARETAYRIYSLTGLQMLSDIGALLFTAQAFQPARSSIFSE